MSCQLCWTCVLCGRQSDALAQLMGNEAEVKGTSVHQLSVACQNCSVAPSPPISHAGTALGREGCLCSTLPTVSLCNGSLRVARAVLERSLAVCQPTRRSLPRCAQHILTLSPGHRLFTHPDSHPSHQVITFLLILTVALHTRSLPLTSSRLTLSL